MTQVVENGSSIEASPSLPRSDRFDAWFDIFTLDPRSASAFRVLLGGWLLFDLIVRCLAFQEVYGGSWLNLDPVRTIAPDFAFSLFWLSKSEVAHRAVFVVAAAAYGSLLYGLRPRLMAAASLICFVSFNHYNPAVYDGGVSITAALLVLACFLPLAVDRPVASLSVFAVRLQVAWIYFSAAITKTGLTWKSGSALWYVTHYDQMATHFGAHLGDLIPIPCFRILACIALAIEHFAPVFLVIPMRTPWLRRAGIVALLALQIGISLVVHTGFQFVLFAALFLCLHQEDWDAIAALTRWQRLTRRTMATVKGNGTRRRWSTKNIILELSCGAWLLVNFMSAVRFYKVDWIPIATDRVLKSLAITQTWNLFAPEAPRTDGWWIFYGIDRAGNEIDLRTGKPLDRSKPAGIWTDFGRLKFKVLESITFNQQYKNQRGWVLVDLFNEFHKRFPSVEFKETRLGYIEEPTPTPTQWQTGVRPNVREFTLWVYLPSEYASSTQHGNTRL